MLGSFVCSPSVWHTHQLSRVIATLHPPYFWCLCLLVSCHADRHTVCFLLVKVSFLVASLLDTFSSVYISALHFLRSVCSEVLLTVRLGCFFIVLFVYNHYNIDIKQKHFQAVLYNKLFVLICCLDFLTGGFVQRIVISNFSNIHLPIAFFFFNEQYHWYITRTFCQANFTETMVISGQGVVRRVKALNSSIWAELLFK